MTALVSSRKRLLYVLDILRRLFLHGSTGNKILRSSTALAIIAIVVRLLSLGLGANTQLESKLITDLGRVGRRVQRRQGEYDPNEYDVVIIGGGTAGCVLASRLSEDPTIRVLLLEAGDSSLNVPQCQVPALYPQFGHTKLDYDLYTVPQSHANQKSKYWPRGKMLGGCSSVNAMIFHHGSPSDYDQWAEYQNGQVGAEDWAYENFSPYFLKFEKFNPSRKSSLVDTSLRGSTGPIQTGHFGNTAESTRSFVEACDNLGIAHVSDLNTMKGTLGSSETMTFIDARGRRVTTESAYLTPKVLSRLNLKVATGAKVTRIVFEHQSLPSYKDIVPRAVGVCFQDSKGNVFEVKARQEVVVSGGAVHTPQILMLSGVGPAEHLTSHKVPVVADLPGVGSQLMDHAVIDLHFMDRSRSAISAVKASDIREKPSVLAALRLIGLFLQWRLTGKGLLTTNVAEAIAFIRSSDPKLFSQHELQRNDILDDTTSGPDAPDVELFFSPMGFGSHGDFPLPRGHHFGLHAILLRPTSKGTIRLKSADPSDSPIIDPQYLSTDHDIAVFVRAVRLLSRLVRTEPLASLLDPAGDADPLLNHNLHELQDDEIVKLVRERVETLYHPTSTARMAPREDGGVVDPFLRVHGIPNLRVVDASIFPTIPSGHTASPTIAVAEKAADIIKKALHPSARS